jgi:hypothetical protein
MAASDQPDESDDHRLAGRTPRTPRPGTLDPPVADDGDGDDESEGQLDAVTRLMGFLRNTDV